MKPSYIYNIRPQLPPELSFLGELAYNLWWSWNFDAVQLFMAIDAKLWDDLWQNPVALLGRARQERLLALADDPGYLSQIEQVKHKVQAYMDEPRWFQQTYPQHQALKVAYFSAEFGLARCLQVYSGGLGILSGDHLKTASDMGLPLVGIGLAYQQGYFSQYLNIDGWQQERYEENDFQNQPITQVMGLDGTPLTIEVPYCSARGPEKLVTASIWCIKVGRVPLYLLSTNLPQNHADDRAITANLYGGDREMRIRQEIVLGIGGCLALKALGIEPSVCHMNEGHSAFLPFERMRELMRDSGLDFPGAFETSASSNVFTTHTPVPAGNDVFENEMLKRYLGPLAESLSCSWEHFSALGRDHEAGGGPGSFCMTVAALRTAAFSNGVSRLHAGTSREMWQSLWPDLPQEEIPIGPVTNGIHLYSWLSHNMAQLFDQYLDPSWRSNPIAPGIWNKIREIPDEELWRVHCLRRSRMVGFTRERLTRQLVARGAPPSEIQLASEILDPDALTIGFARRFATYKRATLLLRDIERLKRLASDSQRPLQFVFAGKAHPRDEEGKRFVREIIHAFHAEPLRGRMVFLEDYGMSIARYMVQGCDVWLNTPRRPLEASGTSGMKVVANGGLHLSTLDGWWDQAYDPSYGWAIGSGEQYEDSALQDEVEGNALYELLEQSVLPQFYDRELGLPKAWIARMKASMANLIPRFTSHRMLRNYIEEAYLPSHERLTKLSANNFAAARELASWRARIELAWPSVQVHRIEVAGDSLIGSQVLPGRSSDSGHLHVHEPLRIRAAVQPGGLAPADLLVEAYAGTVDSQGGFKNAFGQAMELEAGGPDSSGLLHYTATLASSQSGQFGFTVRVIPTHPSLPGKFSTHLIAWADPQQ